MKIDKDTPRFKVVRYDLRKFDIETPAYVLDEYWRELVEALPNPPITASGKAQIVWYDFYTDLLLLHFDDALAYTGHSGIYDGGVASDALFDTHGYQFGCVFVPSGSLDLKKMKVGELSQRRQGLRSGRSTSVKKFSPRAQVCNLAQYHFNATRISQIIGISRQAVHIMLGALPFAVKELTSRPHVQYIKAVDPCAVEGCTNEVDRRSRGRPMKYCPEHMAEFRFKPRLPTEQPERQPAPPKPDRRYEILDEIFGQPKGVDNG